MDNPLIIWAIVFFAAAMVLFLVELFIPSGGLIGLAAGVSLITGIVLLFRVNTMLGLTGATVSMLALPVVIGVGLKIAPNTPILRLLTLRNAESRAADARSLERGSSSGDDDDVLVGHEGQALTDLRPVGTCLIEGRRRECLSDAGFIRAGTPVRIVLADGMQIKVRAIES